MKTLYLICGPSGSGKTYRANQLKVQQNIKHHFEADMWMVDKKGNYLFVPDRLSYCHKSCQRSTEQAMMLGEDVIVSNTTLTKKEAKPYINLAKQYNYKVVIDHMLGNFANLHGVPEWKVEQMKAKHQLFSLEDFNEANEQQQQDCP